MAHKHSVYDTDYHFPIDPVTRTIKNLCGKVTLIQYDHNSERITFEIPRYIDGHDMSLCNQSEVHYNNISNGKTNPGVYPISDLQVDPTDENVVICSWLISHNATQLIGRLAFVVRFACVSEDAVVEYAWNTVPYSEIKVANSIYNSDLISDEFTDQMIDVLAEWARQFKNVESVVQTVTSDEDNGVNIVTVTLTDGTESNFSIRNGSKGSTGYSAYEIAVANGYEGTEEEWNASVNEARIAAELAATNAEASAGASESSAMVSEANASRAQQSAESAAESALSAQTSADSLNINNIQSQINLKGDSLYFDTETNLLYLMSDGEIIGDGVAVAASGTGGGGGGAILEYTISLKNTLDNRVFSVPGGSTVNLEFSYSSVDEDGYADGAGVGTVTVNSVKKATINVPQGDNTLDVTDYLSAGDNIVKVRVENSEGGYKTLTYTITVVTLTITTTLEDFSTQSGDFTFYYTPVGINSKTIYFSIDGTEIGTQTIATSGKSQSYVIPTQSHGGHILEVYATMVYEGTLIISEPVKKSILWVDSTDMMPIVLINYDAIQAIQGETLTIPYMVYDPANENASITMSVLNEDGSVYSSKPLTVGRTAQNWVIQDYPTGNVKFQITCGSVSDDKTIAVTESEVKLDIISDSLALDFNPVGRTNQEDTPASWTDGIVTATFSNVGFSGADGWLTDASGASMLRILPGGEMTIPYQLFSTDRRDSGVTIEVEMSTHNVRDYDSIVMSCLSGGRGFKIASQYAQFSSEQSSLSMQFKEDDRVRLTFVAEPKALNRLIYVYVDGVMCGAIQYPEDDNFQQNPAAGIAIGAESSGIDVYRILLYTKGLTRNEVLDNYIAGRATLQERLAANARNDVLNDAEEIVISKLPATLPYMIIACPELPQFKDDKKTCSITYVDMADPSKSFTAENVQIDVQGTSSAGYKKKNFKPKFKGGFTYTATGETRETYALREDSIPVSTFCLKVDVASSESANNVELVRFYNDVCPYKTPPQKEDSRIRIGIDGLPIVVFWQNTDTGVVKFWSSYNFNNDKSTAETFGLTDGCESWEVRNNTSDRVIFKKSDYSDGWLSDFEARYPEDNTDYTNLKRLTDWLVSTDRSAVDTEEEKAARLEKFKNEFEDYFIKDATLFYYLFTEVFLMVDSRAKNLFPSTFDGVHWLPLPYDMDTALGINNEGALVFDYDLEDTDTVGGEDVFNGQASVLWCNVRDAFFDDIKEMYAELRGGTLFNYDSIIKRFSDHQVIWPEVIWNESAWEKYLEPLVNDNDGSYLSMLQGDKASQREWWLYNGLRYRDSKYQTGDAQKNYITLRCYAVGDITVTPYSHIWPRIKYGSYTVTERGKRNVATKLVCPLDNMNDTEVYIYSSDRLIDIGDLSHLMIGYANFSMANKLTNLKIGDGAEGYQNTRMTELYVGNNELLTTLDIRNCVNLTMTVDLSGCAGLETIEAEGSSIAGLTLPVGGNLRTLHLPSTMANLTVRNMKQLSELTMEGYSALTTLRIENTPNVPLETIVNNAANIERVRLVNIEWTATDESALSTTINRLATCGGLNAEGGNIDTAVVSGRVYVDSISDELLNTICANFPDLVVVVDGMVRYFIRYLDRDSTVLYSMLVEEGATFVDPVASGLIDAPALAYPTDDGMYVYSGWSETLTTINRNYTLVAQYKTKYRVRFLVDEAVYDTQWVFSGESATVPATNPTKDSTVQYVYTFSRWDKDYTNISGPTDINAVFDATLQVYTVSFYNGDTLLQSVMTEYGSSAVYTGDTPIHEEEEYIFVGWSPEPVTITGDTTCYAMFRYTGMYSVKIVNRTLAGSYENDRITSVGPYAFYNCSEMNSVSLPAVTDIGRYAFRYCYALDNVYVPSAKTLSNSAFGHCTALTTIDLPVVTSIANQAFYRCSKLDTIILRSETVCALTGTTVFTETPIEYGTGYIYVPAALIDEYRLATNWSALANQFRAIEDFPEITGGVL